jgi:hypothetical protein
MLQLAGFFAFFTQGVSQIEKSSHAFATNGQHSMFTLRSQRLTGSLGPRIMQTIAKRTDKLDVRHPHHRRLEIKNATAHPGRRRGFPGKLRSNAALSIHSLQEKIK